MEQPEDVDTDGANRAVLNRIATFMRSRYGDSIFVRIGEPVSPWKAELTLDAFHPNPSTSAVEVGLDAENTYVSLGSAIHWRWVRWHERGDDEIAWLEERVATACDFGTSLWRDRRRNVFGRNDMATIAGEPLNVSSSVANRLTLVGVTDSWTAPTEYALLDPAENPGSSAFFIDERLPQSLRRIAIEMRTRYGSAISILTRTDALSEHPEIEIIPTNDDAERVRVRAIGDDLIGVGAGFVRFVEGEYDEMSTDAALTWLNDVANHGILEFTRGRRWYTHHTIPATPAAVRESESDSAVEAISTSPPWLPPTTRP